MTRMLDINKPDEAKLLGEIEKFNSQNSGNAWCIVTEHQGELRLHERVRNPCLGDLRKYKEQTFNKGTRSGIPSNSEVFKERVVEARGIPFDGMMGHKDYTDPYTGNPSVPSDDYYPTDLPYPFPLGKPVALGIAKGFSFGEGLESLNDVIIDPGVSPWRFGLPRQGKIDVAGGGYVINGLDLYPTVLINLLKFREISGYSLETFTAAKSLEPLEILYMIYHGINGGNSYSTPMSIDLWRFMNGQAHDLDGGCLCDRYDYNRKILHEVFGDIEIDVLRRTGDASNRVLKTKGGIGKPSVSKIKEYIAEEYERAAKYHSSKENTNA